MPKLGTRAPAALLATIALACVSGLTAAPGALAGGSPPSDSVETERPPRPWPVLSHGDTGWRVTMVEFLLQAAGFYTGARPAGVMDYELVAAIRNYQIAHDLPESGRLDSPTWSELAHRIGVGPGSLGPQVKAVQSGLNGGYGHDLAVDGIYGPNTRGAILQFQRSKGLTPNGVVAYTVFQAMITWQD
ncbi:peptidoglycan-binding domain-containing protein [Salinactinospora qingdaonensis]|uniref:Peptidoglycan binding-like domain-containing protein n=1 Tax=Salinactinospora qingdaonensis TaxID=702744 RepID=A0ABP7GL80_9ACTN